MDFLTMPEKTFTGLVAAMDDEKVTLCSFEGQGDPLFCPLPTDGFLPQLGSSYKVIKREDQSVSYNLTAPPPGIHVSIKDGEVVVITLALTRLSNTKLMWKKMKFSWNPLIKWIEVPPSLKETIMSRHRPYLVLTKHRPGGVRCFEIVELRDAPHGLELNFGDYAQILPPCIQPARKIQKEDNFLSVCVLKRTRNPLYNPRKPDSPFYVDIFFCVHLGFVRVLPAHKAERGCWYRSSVNDNRKGNSRNSTAHFNHTRLTHLTKIVPPIETFLTTPMQFNILTAVKFDCGIRPIRFPSYEEFEQYGWGEMQLDLIEDPDLGRVKWEVEVADQVKTKILEWTWQQRDTENIEKVFVVKLLVSLKESDCVKTPQGVLFNVEHLHAIRTVRFQQVYGYPHFRFV